MRGLVLAGLVVLAVAWSGLLPALLPPFTAHMTMHMAVVALAAPLLAWGVAGTRLDPAIATPWLAHAVPLSMLELAAVWAWHAPGPHHFARSTSLGLALEQGTFLLTGFLLWGAALGGGEVARRARATAGVTGLLLTAMHMTLLGVLLAVGGRTLYGHHGHDHGHGWLTALQDQQLGGAVMIVAGGVAYALGGMGLVKEALDEEVPA